MTHLSERAEAARIWLEGDWTKHYRKQGGKRWQSSSLVRKLKAHVCGTELDAWEALAELAEAGVIETTAPVSSRQRLNVHVTLSEALRHRLESEFADIDDSLALTPSQAAVWRHALDGVLHGWSLEDQRRLAQGLRELAASLPDAYTMSSFEASARFLLGSSKLLLALPRELVRTFDIDTAVFRLTSVWVLSAIPATPKSLLLIENPQSFEQACRVGVNERAALVCSFGYGLSLAEALKEPNRVRLIGEGSHTSSIQELLELPRQYFWGDLDPEGLRIFLRLRHSLPKLRLSALYGPMIEAFERGLGHPLHALTGKAEQRHAGTLSTGIWSRGLDQEALEDANLVALADQSLDEATQQHWLNYLVDCPAEIYRAR